MRVLQNRRVKAGIFAALPLVLLLVLGNKFAWLPKSLEHGGAVYSVAFSPDGTLLASAGNSGIKLWQIPSRQLLHTLNQAGTVTLITFSRDGSTLAGVGGGNAVRLWDTKSGKIKASISVRGGNATKCALSPDGKMVATWGDSSESQVWDVRNQKMKSRLPHSRVNVKNGGMGGTYTPSPTVAAFSPDSKTIATVIQRQDVGTRQNSEIVLWDATASGRGKLKIVLRDTNGLINSIAFSSDGGTLIDGNYASKLRLWDVRTGKLKTSLKSDGGVRAVAISPDGATIAASAGSSDSRIDLWDIKSGKVIRALSGHDNFIESLDFSPDGRSLASGSHDQTVRLWRIK